MADPRTDTSVVGIGELCATFDIDNSSIVYAATSAGGSASVGLAVTITSAETIATAADAEMVLGKLILVTADNKATVQIKGGMTLPGGDSASLTVGKKIVGAVDGSANEGYVREVDTSAAAELGVARGFIVDAGTTTAIELIL